MTFSGFWCRVELSVDATVLEKRTVTVFRNVDVTASKPTSSSSSSSSSLP
jgi:hypothetical protein